MTQQERIVELELELDRLVQERRQLVAETCYARDADSATKTPTCRSKRVAASLDTSPPDEKLNDCSRGFVGLCL